MRRTAHEVIRNLETRIARLERQAGMKLVVEISRGTPSNLKERMDVDQLMSMVRGHDDGNCFVNIIPDGIRSVVNFICPDQHWSCSVNMIDFVEALKADHPAEMEALMMNALVTDEDDADELALAVQDYLRTSRGSFGGSLGRSWKIIIL